MFSVKPVADIWKAENNNSEKIWISDVTEKSS